MTNVIRHIEYGNESSLINDAHCIILTDVLIDPNNPQKWKEVIYKSDGISEEERKVIIKFFKEHTITHEPKNLENLRLRLLARLYEIYNLIKAASTCPEKYKFGHTVSSMHKVS